MTKLQPSLRIEDSFTNLKWRIEKTYGWPYMHRIAIVALIVLTISSVSVFGNYVHPVEGIVWIEGHITSDTTWAPVDIYRVIGMTYVDTGVILTILPGVEVQFADGFSLIVNGGLNATGNNDNRINFTSTHIDYPFGSWPGIVFEGDEGSFMVIRWARIMLANSGIVVNGTGKVSISDSSIANNNYGVSIFDESEAQFNVELIRNNIWNNKICAIFSNGTYVNGIYIISNDIQAYYFVGWAEGIDFSIDEGPPLGFDHTIVNVTIRDNIINGTLDGMRFNAYQDYSISSDSTIQDVYVYNNTILNVEERALFLDAWTFGGTACISNVTIAENRILFSDVGLDITGSVWGGGTGFTQNLTIRENIISANDLGIDVYSSHVSPEAYDVQLSNNTVASNRIGIAVDDKTRAYIDYNTICANAIGIEFSSTENVALYNNIFDNTEWGTIVSGGAVKAEYNYWGDSTGPYQASLNPEGKGNSVNGNGVDLDFIPFLNSSIGTINERPVAVLEVDKTNPMLNETVTFDATGSTDDGRIDYYLFDFGDGTNSSWTSLPVVTHKYSQQNTYNATLTVMDDFGVTSNNTQRTTVQVIVIPEFSSIIMLPLFMLTTLAIVIAWKKKRFKSS